MPLRDARRVLGAAAEEVMSPALIEAGLPEPGPATHARISNARAARS